MNKKKIYLLIGIIAALLVTLTLSIKHFSTPETVNAEKLAAEMGVTPITEKPSPENLIIKTQEARELYDRIMAGDYPTVEEMQNSSTIAQIDRLSDYYTELYGITAEIDTPERRELREKIKEEFLSTGSARLVTDETTGSSSYVYDGDIETGYWAELVLGLPASGKSTRATDPDSEKMKAFIFDCDVIKELIPEYQESFGGAANSVHAESEMIQQSALVSFTEGENKGKNIIFPVVAVDVDDLFRTFITPMEEAGYTVKVKFMECELNASIARNLARELRTGRIIHSSVVFSFGDKPRKVFDELCKRKNPEGEYYADESCICY
ncbi:MAG: zeta toxin family protein [Lachnospiraceae bacterium]|nr:zeta toxin family protein [Lachnospiraceae bacterium]